MLVGMGFDVHKLVPKRPFIVGGIKLDYPKGPLGHSDGDVLFHALCDALLGAAGLGDIGDHFPDTSEVTKDANSREFVRTVNLMVLEMGYKPVNVDATIFLEEPKLTENKKRIALNIAELLSLPPERVNVKAKTLEGLGMIGKGKQIAAQVIVGLTKL